MEFDWINLLQVLGGVLLGTGVGVFTVRATIRKSNAEADKAEHEANKAGNDRLIQMIDHQQKSLDRYLEIEKDNADRIAELNKAINEKTEQIRRLTEQVIASEHGRNADKDEITRLTAEAAELRVLVEHYRMWHCQNGDCESRVPPNKQMRGMKYSLPKSGK